MAKWITAADGSLVNLDHVLSIEVIQADHNTCKIVADLGANPLSARHRLIKYLLSSDNEKGVDLAFEYLTKSLMPNDAHNHGFLANTVREEKDKTNLPQHLDPAGKANAPQENKQTSKPRS